MSAYATERPAGLTTIRLDADQAIGIAEAASSATPPPIVDAEVTFAVAEFDHCYNVAHCAAGEWVWASTILRRSATMPASAPVHQLNRVRLFGAHTEIIVHANEDGQFAGFQHTLAADAQHQQPSLQPRERTYLLIGTPSTRLQYQDGFTVIHHPSGQVAVIPFAFAPDRTPLGGTREHFTADPETGAVRVAAVTWTGFSNGAPLAHDGRKESA